MKSFVLAVFVQLLIIIFTPIRNGQAQTPVNINNPVLPGVADAGVIRFNGEYYIGGVFTNGSFYRSSDLVKWEGPFHVFSMDNDWTSGRSADDSQIHANDINYVNGVFHQYWSVNYWGKDQHVVHIGHATASRVLGPYKEPVKETWVDNRIDPELFLDDDGTPYLYMVKFTDGNAIWARKMKDPWTFSGEPVSLFASLPNTWETLDNRVAEGPWVIKYRDRYYMMYNTNHTSPIWGNYALGVAEADSPLGFNHGTKYPAPVVKSNQIDLEDEFVDLLKYSDPEPGDFRYTVATPGSKWNAAKFDDSAWQKGQAGFGSTIVKNSTTRKIKTSWNTSEIWLRKYFTLDKTKRNLMLRIHHDGETKVFLNGQSIYENRGRQYISLNLEEKVLSLLKQGENVLAIQGKRGENSNFLDVSLFDMRDKAGDDILYSPGQPNILRGPNGFEWWLIYMANKNSERRGQYINRIHFFGKKLFADAVTGTHTPGYHPNPAPPTFGDLFNEADERIETKWRVQQGTWRKEDGELVQSRAGAAHALVNSSPASHYLFETGVKMQGPSAKAGIWAWWQDQRNCLGIQFDQQQKSWRYVLTSDGKSEAVSFPLPADFNYQVYHSIRVYKNAGTFTVQIDERPAPGNPVISAGGLTGKGVPGLYAEGSASFDGVLYTIGWDEFDNSVAGWSSSSSGRTPTGSWSVSGEGIVQVQEKGVSEIFKGDLLNAYEVSLQLTNETDKGSVGLYPIYIDEDNFLKSMFDFETRQLVVIGKMNGKSLATSKVSLARNSSYYADMKFTDFIEKRFALESPAYIDALTLSKKPHGADTLIEDIYKKINISFKQKDKWHPLADWKETSSSHPGFDRLAFAPIKADAIRVVNRDAEDHERYIYRIRVHELLKESYNIRVAKLKDSVIFLIDGQEVLRIPHRFPASQIGLTTENTKASFNGITLFELR